MAQSHSIIRYTPRAKQEGRPQGFPLARAPGVQTSDPALARRHISRFFRLHEFVLPLGQRLNLRHHHAALGDIGISALSYGADAVIRSKPLKDFYLVQWTLAGSCIYGDSEDGQQAGPDSLFVVNPDLPHGKRWSADCVQLIMRIDRGLVDGHLGVPGERRDAPLRFAPGPHGREGPVRPLFELLEFFLTHLDGPAGGTDQAVSDRHLQAALVNMLLALLPHDGRAESASRRADPPASLRHAADFIKVNARGDIDLDMLAAAAGLSPRRLQGLFRQHLDTTPLQYLKHVRLDMARRDLLEARAAGRTVTEVALDCGFRHTGRFAQAFRLRFGTAPSQLLKA